MLVHHLPTTPQSRHFDVVVIGARPAGAATAMLLARSGARVLVVDKSAYGADTLSTHALMRGAVSQLERWGIAPALRRTTPAITSVRFCYGPDEIVIDATRQGTVAPLMAPRRTLLDPTLADAAADAGAEVRFGTRFVDVLVADGVVRGVVLVDDAGRESVVTADLVVGADGLRSSVARKVGARITRSGRAASATVMRYFEACDVPNDQYRWLYGPARGAGVIPTNDGTAMVFVGVPPARFAAEIRSDVGAGFHRVLEEIDPALAAAVAAARPAGPWRSFPGHVGQFRQAHGPGWALVGDAGYFKDPYAAHGISDALRDAELLADAVVAGDLDDYESTRDRLSLPLFGILEQIASYEWTLETLPDLHLRLSKAMTAELAEVTRLWTTRPRQQAA